MPKEKHQHTKAKKTPFQIPSELRPSRKHSLRHSENFGEVLVKFQSACTMSDAGQLREGGLGGKEAVNGPPSTEPDHEAKAEEAALLATALSDLRKRRDKPRKRLLAFSSVTGATRRMLNELGAIVTLFRDLKDIEKDVSAKYSEWLLVCGKNEADLEAEDNPLKPSVIDEEIEDVGKLVDKVEEAFKLVKQQYPEKQEVIDYLDFIDMAPIQLDLGRSQHQRSPSNSNVSEPAALGGGEEYLRAKIPILKRRLKIGSKL